MQKVQTVPARRVLVQGSRVSEVNRSPLFQDQAVRRDRPLKRKPNIRLSTFEAEMFLEWSTS